MGEYTEKQITSYWLAENTNGEYWFPTEDYCFHSKEAAELANENFKLLCKTPYLFRVKKITIITEIYQ